MDRKCCNQGSFLGDFFGEGDGPSWDSIPAGAEQITILFGFFVFALDLDLQENGVSIG
jgi:hypothetical protein